VSQVPTEVLHFVLRLRSSVKLAVTEFPNISIRARSGCKMAHVHPRDSTPEMHHVTRRRMVDEVNGPDRNVTERVNFRRYFLSLLLYSLGAGSV